MGKEKLGWGTAIGKIFNWLPSKEESLQNEMDKLKRQMADLQSKRPFNIRDSVKYRDLAERLRQIEQRYKNI